MQRCSDQYPLRLPDGWRKAIKDRAKRNRRSMNSEILAALECVVSETAVGKVSEADTPAAVKSNAA